MNVAALLMLEGAMGNYFYRSVQNETSPYTRFSWWHSNNTAYRYLHKIIKRGIILIHTNPGTVESTEKWGNDIPGAVSATFYATMNVLIPKSKVEELKAYMNPLDFAIYSATTYDFMRKAGSKGKEWEYTTFHIDQKSKDVVVDREDIVYLLNGKKDDQKVMLGHYQYLFPNTLDWDLDSNIKSLATEIYIVDTRANRRVDSADGLYTQLELYTRRYMSENPITQKDRALVPKYSPDI